jgi:hypothetical protein
VPLVIAACSRPCIRDGADPDLVQGGGQPCAAFLGAVTLDELNRLLRSVNEELTDFGIPYKQYHSRLQHAQCTARVP